MTAPNPTTTSGLTPQHVGNVGLYWCCYKLTRLGWNAMSTARNARGVDIIAYANDASTVRALQVKALSRKSPVPLGKSLDKIMGDFWLIVVGAQADGPETFILTPGEVRAAALRGEKDGRISYWLPPSRYRAVPFREAWHRIGNAPVESSIKGDL